MGYEIYVDGSAQKNQKNINNIGGFGYVVYNNNIIIDAYSKQVTNTTNNEMELTALVNVIKKYGTTDPWEAPSIYSDSRYAIQCLTVWAYKWSINNWKTSTKQPIENLVLIKEGFELLCSGNYCVNIEYCKGHSGILGNEIADRLATGRLSPEEVLNGNFIL